MDEQDILLDAGWCPVPYRNFAERTYLVDQEGIRLLQAILIKKYPAASEAAGLDDMRRFIADWRRELGLDDRPAGLPVDEVTVEFLAAIGFFS